MLKEVKKKTALQAATEALRNYIIDSRLKPGDSLPTEHELMKALNVSRSVIREALIHFRTLGILDSRQRKGIRIKQLIPDNPFNIFIPYLEASPEMVRELFQVRMIIETGMVPLLIEKACPGNLEELECLAVRMRDARHDARIELDREFHCILMDIVGNRMLERIQPMLDYFDISSEKGYSAGQGSAKSALEVSREHLDIVNAIREKDADRLRDIFISRHYQIGE
jgi:DNA-binding FadR family transcriptional regulator